MGERPILERLYSSFMQVQEAASGSSNVQMPDVWINLAHVHFAQGNFALAVKMVSSEFSCWWEYHFLILSMQCIFNKLCSFLQYQNCLRKFYYNTDSQVLLYLARTHYEAEQWQDCKKTLLRAIHLAPSNYTLKFDVGVALQKFSASTLQKTKRTVDEVIIFYLILFRFLFKWVEPFLVVLCQ